MSRTRDSLIPFTDGVKFKGLPIFMVGKPIDGRADFTTQDLDKITTLTRKRMKRNGHQPAVKLGHAGFVGGREQQPRRGYLKKVYRGQFESHDGAMIEGILADAIFDKELAELYQTGRYPGISAELYALNWLEKLDAAGKDDEWFIDAVAMLGEESPAFTELFSKRVPGQRFFSVIKNDPNQEKSMDPRIELKAMMEKFAADSASDKFTKAEATDALDEIETQLAKVREFVDEQDGDDSDTDDDTTDDADATDDNAATKAELAAAQAEIVKLKAAAKVKGNHKLPKDQPVPKAELAAMQAEIDTLKNINGKAFTDARDQVFNGLVADGRITKGERDVFDVIADKKGDDYARMHYAAQPATKGPQSKLFASLTGDIDDPEQKKFLATLPGHLSDKEITAMSDEYRRLVAAGEIVPTTGVN